MNEYNHEAWLAAHYALGRIEVDQGFTLNDKERSNFLRNYMADYTRSKSVDTTTDKLEA